MPKRVNLDIPAVIESYKTLGTVKKVANKFDVSPKTITNRLKKNGVNISRRIKLPVNKIVELYKGGMSENAIAKKFDVTRNVIRRRLESTDTHIRAQSEAETLKWSQMSESKRQHQVKAAHEAIEGRELSFEQKCKTAKTREQTAGDNPAIVSEHETILRRMLAVRGIDTIWQKAIGPYNCDLAATPVAVEVYGGGWHWHGRHVARVEERFNYILNAGWFIYVVPIYGRFTLTAEVADHIASYINRIRRDKPTTCEYRVVWGAGEFTTAGSLNDNNISIEPPFTCRRNPSTGRYETIPR